jgi:diguanylate cyclase (GGDEF)-like protein
MAKQGVDLERQIVDLLNETEDRDHPLYGALDQLWRRHQDLARRIERISKISDSYQSIVKERELSLGEQLDRQLRQLEKVARISDRYQSMMRDSNTALKKASTQDELTGIPNRRYLLERLKQESSRSERSGHPLGMAMLDLDFFKRINDAHGHDIGDKVLVEASRVMHAAMREHDICGRWGGEEFLFLFPDTSLSSSAQVMERVLANIREISIQHKDTELKITASAGVAQQRPAESYSDTINRADRALLRAKRDGRDQLHYGED